MSEFYKDNSENIFFDKGNPSEFEFEFDDEDFENQKCVEEEKIILFSNPMFESQDTPSDGQSGTAEVIN